VFDLWKALGLEKKAAPDTSYLTQGIRPYQSLTEIPVGASLNDIILKGLKGEGWGFAPEFIDKTTSPVVAQREARFKNYELPTLTSELSSRGMGRSSIAGQQIGEATAQKERDINSVIAEAYAKDQAQRKLDEARFQSLGQWWTGAEAGQRGAYSADDAMRRQYALEKELAYQNAKEDERIQNLNRTIGYGLSILSPMPGATWNAMTGTQGSAGTAKSFSDQLAEKITELNRLSGNTTTTTAAQPFTTSPIDFQMLYNLFAGL